MPKVNPQMLVWARETAGLTQEAAARKIGIRDSQKMTAVEKMAAVESGERTPSRSMLVEMEKKYRRPLVAFYMTKPPRKADRGTDFRLLPDSEEGQISPELDALIRDVRARQTMIRALLESEDEAESLPFVGMLRGINIESPINPSLLMRTVESVRKVLDFKEPSEHYEQENATEAFKLLRSKAEAAGVFVLLKSDLGSYHSSISAREFRGFAIADTVAPFVVINRQDTRPAWSFTLLHEVVHLLLGNTGISGGGLHSTTEVFCNTVASECLLPTLILKRIGVSPQQDISEQEQEIRSFARQRNLSATMVAYRLFRVGTITKRTYGSLSERYAEYWEREREVLRERLRESYGGPSYYVVRRSRIGSALLSLTKRMIHAGALSTTKAAIILGVKPTQVGELLHY